MNRLQFLKKSGRTALGALVAMIGLSGAMTLTSCTNENPPKKVIGLQLYSVRDSIYNDVTTTLEEVAKMGYATLETAGYNDGKLYGIEPQEFKEKCESLGMKVTGAHLGHSYQAENDSAIMQWWEQAIETQRVAGCKYVVQASFPIGETKDDIITYADYFNRVGEMANEKGMMFGLHNHMGEFKIIDNQHVFDILIENTKPENVFFELDVYWAKKAGMDPVELLKKYPDRIKVLHVKDESIIGETGEIDFEGIFNQFYANGYQDFYVEVERYTMPPFNCVERSYDYLEVSNFVK